MTANKKLSDLRGLGNLVNVGRSFIITECPAVRSLNGLQRLKATGSLFMLQFMWGLETLEFVDALATVGEDLIISNNVNLKSLESLASSVTRCAACFLSGVQELITINCSATCGALAL